jgi:predicted GNAT superfamily acetyltransferase
VGGTVIYWTFDPLVARNAHLNFNVLGTRAVRYVRDMYGDNTGSELHRGIGTDRLIVAWDVNDTALAARKLEVSSARKTFWNAAKLIGDAERLETRTKKWAQEGILLALAVPMDIAAIQAENPKLAAKWRSETRAAFQSTFDAGYVVSGFMSDKTPPRGYYLLSKPQSH